MTLSHLLLVLGASAVELAVSALGFACCKRTKRSLPPIAALLGPRLLLFGALSCNAPRSDDESAEGCFRPRPAMKVKTNNLKANRKAGVSLLFGWVFVSFCTGQLVCRVRALQARRFLSRRSSRDGTSRRCVFHLVCFRASRAAGGSPQARPHFREEALWLQGASQGMPPLGLDSGQELSAFSCFVRGSRRECCVLRRFPTSLRKEERRRTGRRSSQAVDLLLQKSSVF